MQSSLAVLALAGFAVAGPVKTTFVRPTPAPGLVARQEEATATVTDSVPSCAYTTFPYTSFSQEILNGDGNGGIVTSTSWYTLEESDGCTCDGGLIAGLRSSVDPFGTYHVYCATGTPQGSAVATVVPTGTVGDEDNAAWLQVKCDSGPLATDSANPNDKWNEAGAKAAWDDAVSQWYFDNQPDGPDGFSNYVAGFFDTRENPNCNNLKEANCQVTIECGQGSDPNAATNSPAGMVVFNSMVNLHKLYEFTYGAVLDALPNSLADVGKMVESFSPINDQIKAQQRLKLALDATLAAITFTLAPLIHSGLSRAPWFKAGNNANVFGSLVDSTYGALGASMAAVKDSMEALSPLPVQNEISSMISDVTDNWKQALIDANNMTFSDPARLGPMISEGQYLDAGFSEVDPLEAQKTIEKMILGAVLPMLWLTGDSEIKWPVIVTSDGLDGGNCDEKDITSYKLDHENIGRHGYEVPFLNYDNDVQTVGKICSEDGSTAFWLAGTSGFEVPVTSAQSPNSEAYWKMTTTTLGHYEDLDGSQYGGLTLQDVTLNAVNGWAFNGNNNNWDLPDATDVDFVESLSTGEISKSRGLVRIPVCSIQQVWETMDADRSNDQGNNNYPCPP